MSAFRLAEAAICIDCEAVFNAPAYRRCPGCGSEHFQFIDAFLQRRDGNGFEAKVAEEVQRLPEVRAYRIVGLKKQTA